MKFKSIFHKLLFLAAIGVSTLLLLFVITATYIGAEVKNECQKAQEKYDGDCIEALSALVDDESQPFGRRNSAIWALGQLGDSRALPVLEKHYTGNIPDREPWNGVLSQYEMKKALKLARGGLNISAPIWRGW